MSATKKTGKTREATEPEPADTAGTAGTDTAGTEAGGTIAELQALVAQLMDRVQLLETQAAMRHPEVSEEVLLAIAAACAAYLGKRATVKQVHLRRGSTWASQGRAAVQQSHADLHGAR